MSGPGSVSIDTARLCEMASGCGWSLTELAEFYEPRARAEIEELCAACARGDTDDVKRLAHGAAGSSASLGLTSLSLCYRAIERCASDGANESVDAAIDAAREHLARALERLEEMARAGP